ncbi:MAG: penicillin acylase family protein [Pseudomonadota bacterium]
MTTLFRWLLRGFLAASVLAGLALLLAYYLATGSIPDYDDERTVAGLDGPVEIVRDAYAVPHIFGESDHDVFFGLGYAHAQDRLWQMTMLRRTAQGRLSELFGTATLSIDELLRALDLYTLSTRMVANQTPETVAALQAYADGVNAWIRIVEQDARGRGAPEFFLFSNAIAPWTPADSIAVTRVMALQLTSHARFETRRAELSLVLPPERLADVLPDNPNDPVIDLPDYASLFPDGTRFPEPEAGERQALWLSPDRPAGLGGASNAWAAMGARSASGAPLLATDPHLGLTAPAIWMLARLEFPDGGAIGATIPGLPGIIIGRNDDFGWGITTAYLDDQDLYIEQLDPEDSGRYRTPDGFAPFETRDILIEVAGQAAVQRTLRWSRNGPVIPPEHFGVGEVTPEGHVATLAWPALDVEDRAVEGLIRVMRARSVAEGRQILSLVRAPAQNAIMADRSTVALQMFGAMPRRQPGHTSQGRIPAPGWLAVNDWQGYFDYGENPSVIAPESGIVANTNNRLSDAPFPNHVSFVWGDSQRMARLQRLLNEREFHTLASFREAQTDTVSPTARNLLPLIARDLWWEGQPPAEDSQGRLRQAALALLAGWNGEMTEHGPEPLIYAAWTRALQTRLIADELGSRASILSRMEPVFIERAFRNIDGAGIWCDVDKTEAEETCREMAERALDDALDELTDSFGSRMETWRWGEAHVALHQHEVLGQVPLLALFTDIVQETSGGDHTLMRGQTAGRGDRPYANIHGAGFRGLYDFDDPDASQYIISTGQSGHFLSRHYDDLSVLWRRGEYIPMSLDPDQARGGAVGITRLRPAPDG